MDINQFTKLHFCSWNSTYVLEDAGTFGIYKIFWNYLNSCEFDDLPLFLVSEEGVSKRLHEN